MAGFGGWAIEGSHLHTNKWEHDPPGSHYKRQYLVSRNAMPYPSSSATAYLSRNCVIIFVAVGLRCRDRVAVKISGDLDRDQAIAREGGT